MQTSGDIPEQYAGLNPFHGMLKESEIGEQTTLYCDSPAFSIKKSYLQPNKQNSGKHLSISLQ